MKKKGSRDEKELARAICVCSEVEARSTHTHREREDLLSLSSRVTYIDRGDGRRKVFSLRGDNF